MFFLKQGNTFNTFLETGAIRDVQGNFLINAYVGSAMALTGVLFTLIAYVGYR